MWDLDDRFECHNRSKLDSQHRGPRSITRMLAYFRRTKIKAAIHLRDTKGKNGLEKATKMTSTIILEANLSKEALGSG